MSNRIARWAALGMVLMMVTAPFVVAQPTREADLVVSQIVVSPQNPQPGDMVSVQATIENVGDADADEAFNVRFHLSLAPDQVAITFGAPINDFTVAIQRVGRGLRAGQSQTISFNWEVVAVPLVRMRVTVDSPLNKIDESNELNNRLETSFFLEESAIEAWWLEAIRVREAHAITEGSEDIVVAVIDTGIDWAHPEIAGQLWVNPGEIAGNGVDDDENGFVDDVHGWDFVDRNNNLGGTSRDLHATAVGGLIAAANDGVGTTGVAPNVRLMDVRVLGTSGSGSFDDVTAGILYAAQNGAHIINLSLGTPEDPANFCSPSIRPICRTQLDRLLGEQQEAVDFALSQGVVVIASAGNDDGGVGFPARFDAAIAIAATARGNERAGYSNFGDEIELSAPGGAISIEQLKEFFTLFSADFGQLVPQLTGLLIAPYPGDGYGWFSGTSASAPLVSGVAALMLSVNPALTPAQVRELLAQSAQDLGSRGFDEEFGAGLLDALSAVEAAQALAD